MATSRARNAARGRPRAAPRDLPPFDHQLVLARWMLRVLGAARWEDLPLDALKAAERDPWLSMPTPYARELRRGDLGLDRRISLDELDRVDARIVAATERVNERRAADPVRWKYFQYLALFFTEIYLERFFADREGLRRELDAAREELNEKLGLGLGPYAVDPGDDFGSDPLARLAFWMATGSGKTLLLHAHYYQYRAACERHGRPQPDNVLIVVPGPGLARQHEREARASGIRAYIFDKNRSRQLGQEVDILPITSLGDRDRETTVAIGRFEGENLVFVDEGHRGSATEDSEWRRRRQLLAQRGFCFEYSATLKQAAARGESLRQEYARSIVLDYSYRRFFEDGYGKHHRVLNLAQPARPRAAAAAPPRDPAVDELERRKYLTGAMLAFYQQVSCHADAPALVARQLLAPPLCIFVGASVVGARDADALKRNDKSEQTDVVEVIGLLARMVSEPEKAKAILTELLAGTAGFLTKSGANVLSPTTVFPEVLARWNGRADALYDDLLRQVFRASGPGRLRVRELKEADGELALSVGEGEPFGVVNVGDAAGVRKLCEESLASLVVVEEKAIGPSLFERIEQSASPIRILIGSRKFAEGWSSWRVSMMGLLNLGRQQGTQIIQLFGRGVRLKGEGMSLKRASTGRMATAGTDESRLRVLETLNVFGVRADYIKAFQEELEQAGIEEEAKQHVETLPVVQLQPLPRLRLVKVPEPDGFRKTTPFSLAQEKPDARISCTAERLPTIQASTRLDEPETAAQRPVHKGPLECFAFVDHERIYADLVAAKRRFRWINLELPRRVGATPLSEWLLALSPCWYDVVAPDSMVLELGRLEHLELWQGLASELVVKYAEELVDRKLRAWQTEHSSIVWLHELAEEERRRYFPDEYVVTIDDDGGLGQTAVLVDFVRKLAAKLARGEFDDQYPSCLYSRGWARSLYTPLLHVPKRQAVRITTKPVALNEGEWSFVQDLAKYVDGTPAVLAGWDVYLLRNEARKGIGLQRFYPDFLLWMVKDGDHRLTFVDPKGLRNIVHADDPKLNLWKSLRRIEALNPTLGVKLDSWLVSVTPEAEAPDAVRPFAEHHVVEQHPGSTTYIADLVKSVLAR